MCQMLSLYGLPYISKRKDAMEFQGWILKAEALLIKYILSWILNAEVLHRNIIQCDIFCKICLTLVTIGRNLVQHCVMTSCMQVIKR